MEDVIESVLTHNPQQGQSKLDRLHRYQRTLYNSLERVVIDEKGQHVDVLDNLSEILKKDSPKTVRLQSALRLVKYCTPQVVLNQLAKHLEYSDKKLPFDSNMYDMQNKIGQGGMNSVFLMQSKDTQQPSYVFKVNRYSYESNKIGDLLTIAFKQKKDFEEIRDTFKEIPDLVAEEYYLVAHDPRKGQGVSMMVQPFIGGQIRDVFEVAETKEQEMKELLETNPNLRQQLNKFVDVIRTHPFLIDKIIDILGEQNLAIVGQKGKERLLLLDPHYIENGSNRPELKGRISERIDKLSVLIHANEPVNTP